MGELLEACVRATGSSAELRWTAPEIILDAGIEPWTQLPVWVPPGTDLHDALHAADVSRAVATGLSCRPAEETVADTWSWLTSIGGTAPQRPDRTRKGLDPEVEAKVLAAGAGGAPERVEGVGGRPVRRRDAHPAPPLGERTPPLRVEAHPLDHIGRGEGPDPDRYQRHRDEGEDEAQDGRRQ